MLEGIDLGDVLVTAAGAQPGIDPAGATVADCASNILAEATRDRCVNAFEVSAAFEEIRIQQVGIQSILLDVLPVGPDFPSMPARDGITDQAEAAAVAEGDADLVRFDVVSLRRESRDRCAVGREVSRVGGGGFLGALPALEIVAHVAKQAGIELVEPEIEFEGHFDDEKMFEAGLIVGEAGEKARCGSAGAGIPSAGAIDGAAAGAEVSALAHIRIAK